MSGSDAPLVSVVTPVYNGEDFLAECIESVLRADLHELRVSDRQQLQHRPDAGDRSELRRRTTTGSGSQQRPASSTSSRTTTSLSASSLPAAKYCKVVSADDLIFAECLCRMVDLAEANPSVGIVGSLPARAGAASQLAGIPLSASRHARPRSLPSKSSSRGEPSFGFGTPTSILYRADLVRSSNAFYPNPSPHADTSACFACLRNSDFGFVYQVLSYQRIHQETQSSRRPEINRYASANLSDLLNYGPSYLSREELEHVLEEPACQLSSIPGGQPHSLQGKGLLGLPQEQARGAGLPPHAHCGTQGGSDHDHARDAEPRTSAQQGLEADCPPVE